ncbi:MAG: DUF2520 domain-containing protein [Wenzhouxiangella sp.]|nr:DUF2520 domain-containing protein [Wenzhouxiangella sp.]
MSRPHVHCYGCGRAARVILRWLHQADLIQIGQICNRSLESSRDAVAFLGAGQAVVAMDAAVNGGWLMLGLPDGALNAAALGLSCRMPGQPELVFHLSGSMPASALEPLGAPVAAVHPVRAFSDPATAVAAMPATWCVGEGETEPLSRLKALFCEAGARWAEITPAGKPAYHAATVAASNYLVALNDMARSLAQRSGLDGNDVAELLADLQQAVIQSLRTASPEQALTGPIERGDEHALARLLPAADGAGHAELFRALGRATLSLAQRKRGELDSDAALARALTSRPD